MKFVRPFFITLAVLAALALAALAVVLSPSFQRWAVLRAMAKQPELKFELASVSAGFSRLELTGVALAPSGVQVQLKHLVAEYELWPLLWSRRVQIRRVQIDGLMVDATKIETPSAAAKAAAAPGIAPGILAQLELPVAVGLGECRIDGQLLLAASAGQPPIPVEFQLTGGEFAPGREGTLVLTAAIKNPDSASSVSQLKAQIRLQATQTDRHTFNKIMLSALVDADGKNISGQNQLKLTSELSQLSSGEHYAIDVATLKDGQTSRLLTVQAELPNTARSYSGQWSLKAEASQLRPYFMGRDLPEFTATGQGHFQVSPAESAIDCQGELAVALSRLEAIDPAWRAIRSVKLDTTFDLAVADGVASIRQGQLALSGENPVLALKVTPGLRVNLREQRLELAASQGVEVLSLKLLGLPLAWVRPFVTAVDISGGQITGEWSLGLAQEQVRLHSVQPLKIGGLTVVQAGQMLLNKADLTMAFESNLAAKILTTNVERLALKTPAGDSLTVKARLVYPLEPKSTITATTSYQFDLPTLLAPWVALGRVQGSGSGEVALTGQELALRQWETTANDASGALLLKIGLLKPFAVRLDMLTISESPAKTTDLLRINLGRVALGALPLTEPDTKLEGAMEASEWTLSALKETLNFRAIRPLKLTGVSLAEAQGPVLTKLSIEAQPQIDVGSQTKLRAQSGDVTIRTQAGATLATLKADADGSPQMGWRATLVFGLEIPQLASQPMFAGVQAVSAGRASGEVRVALNQLKQVEARLTVNGLVERSSGQTLPVANLSFQGMVDPSGKITLKAPLLLDRAGKRSDIFVAMDLTPVGTSFNLNGSLSGDQMELADLLAMVGVFSAPSVPARATASAPTKIVADKEPVWSRINGQLQIALKSITRGPDWSVTGLNGAIQVEPTKITLEKLEAAFGEKGRLAAQGGVTFTAATAQPYQLAGNFSVTEFDAGRLFKALEPGRPATIEGLFSVSADFAGRGETLERVLERSHGQFALTSRGGVFRGLQRTTSKLSKTTKAVELGASMLGSLLGKDNVTKAAEKVAGTAYFVDQLATELGEIKYDQLSLKLTRDTALNLKLEDLSLVAPEIRLMGQGTVTFMETKPLLEQPLTASLSLAARGKVEELLGKLRLVGTTRDELGYAKAKETLTVTGTISKPDPTAFFTKIATGKLTDFLGGDN